MGAWSGVLTCLTVLLATPALTTDPPLPDISNPLFIKTCVMEHNRHRANVQPPASDMRFMTWDEGLAVTARGWARKCLFIHNTYLKEEGKAHPVFSSVGENLWAGTHFSETKAIKSWVDEVKDYNYYSQTCKPKQVCGHYTQVVWANTYKVGCAVQFCPNGVDQTYRPVSIFVCNYATAGNIYKQKPYRTGAECSDCAGDLCVNKLCSNADRDTLRSYNWTLDWDPPLSECGSLCKAVLISRPASLLIIFVSVYCIQRRYPDLFAYT